jgi:hypothetical protein
MFLGSSISSLDACRIHRSLSQGPQFTLYFVGHFAWLHHFVCLISRLFLLSLDACRIHQPLSQGLQFILFRFSDTPSLFGCTPNSSVLVTRTTINYILLDSSLGCIILLVWFLGSSFSLWMHAEFVDPFFKDPPESFSCLIHLGPGLLNSRRVRCDAGNGHRVRCDAARLLFSSMTKCQCTHVKLHKGHANTVDGKPICFKHNSPGGCTGVCRFAPICSHCRLDDGHGFETCPKRLRANPKQPPTDRLQ